MNPVDSFTDSMPPLVPALVTAVLFMVVSNVQVYEMTNNLVVSVLPDMPLLDDDGHPTMLGHALHGLVLAALLHLTKDMIR